MSAPGLAAPPRACADAAFHGLVGEFVDRLDAISEADRVALLAEALVALGSILGPQIHARVGAQKHAGNLFVAVVGGTSSGKGSASREVAPLMRAVDQAWASGCVHSGLVSGEGLLELVRDPRWVMRTRRTPAGPEAEYVCADPGVGDKRCLVRESEFGRVLRALKSGSLAGVVRDAWDGGDLASSSRSAPMRCTATHVSLIAHITIAELKREMDAVALANGFANRFIWLHACRAKVIAIPGTLEPALLAALVSRLRRAVAIARARGAFEWDREATARWKEVYAQRLAPLQPLRSGPAAQLLARAAPQVLRLALIYAAMDEAPAIGTAHLEAALALWKYAEETGEWVAAEVALVPPSGSRGLPGSDRRTRLNVAASGAGDHLEERAPGSSGQGEPGRTS